MTRYCAMCGHRFGPYEAGEGVCPDCGAVTTDGPGGAGLVDLEHAAAKARPAAIGLMAAGALTLLAGLSGPAFIGYALFAEGIGDEADRPGRVAAAALFGFAGLAVLAVGGLILAGGFQMYHLRTWGLGLSAAIATLVSSVLMVGSLLLCCPFVFVGVVTLPIGIWALVVLGDPQVKAAFR